MKKAVLAGGICLVILASLFAITRTYDHPPAIASFTDRNNRPIGSLQTAYQGLEFWTPLAEIPSSFIDRTIAAEDRFFYWHPGFNPVSLLKAGIDNLRAGHVVRGGSTITQQVARNLLQEKDGEFRSRTILHKIEEATLALGLEVFHSKKWILARYLNAAYYGHHAYGAAAAAQIYFGKPLATLTGAEETTLVTLPRAPGKLSKNLEVRSGLPSLTARHYMEYLTSLGQSGAVHTTLDVDLQAGLEASLKNMLEDRATGDAKLNAAAVVIDVATGDVLAMVGSRAYLDDTIHGAFNHAVALRQPGSTLKPFTYFAAFERGFGPNSIVADLPVSFTTGEDSDGYAPQNYDRRFHGPLSIREALGNSLNVPAVVTLNEIGLSYYCDLLKRFGITSLTESPSHYGLSLTLGSGEVSLLELTNAYAALARGGRFKPVRLLSGNPVATDIAITKTGETSAGLITSILTDPEARLRSFGHNENLSVEGHTVAVKTGTSYNHRDNWTVGYTPQYAVGIWVGHSDDTPMEENSTGASVAAPLWHAVMEQLVRGKPDQDFAFARKNLPTFAQAGKRRARVESESLTAPWHVTAPLPGSSYRVLSYLPEAHQQIPAEAIFNSSTKTSLHWFLDETYLGETDKTHARLWLNPVPGRHELRVQDDSGHETRIPFQIVEAPL